MTCEEFAAMQARCTTEMVLTRAEFSAALHHFDVCEECRKKVNRDNAGYKPEEIMAVAKPILYHYFAADDPETIR